MMLGCCKYPYALYQVFGARETQQEILISYFKWRTNFNNFTMHVDKFDDLLRNFREFLHMLWEAEQRI